MTNTSLAGSKSGTTTEQKVGLVLCVIGLTAAITAGRGNQVAPLFSGDRRPASVID